jgi:hypothetical protein
MPQVNVKKNTAGKTTRLFLLVVFHDHLNTLHFELGPFCKSFDLVLAFLNLFVCTVFHHIELSPLIVYHGSDVLELTYLGPFFCKFGVLFDEHRLNLRKQFDRKFIWEGQNATFDIGYFTFFHFLEFDEQ